MRVSETLEEWCFWQVLCFFEFGTAEVSHLVLASLQLCQAVVSEVLDVPPTGFRLRRSLALLRYHVDAHKSQDMAKSVHDRNQMKYSAVCGWRIRFQRSREALASEGIVRQLPTEGSCLSVFQNSGDPQPVERCWCCSCRQALQARWCHMASGWDLRISSKDSGSHFLVDGSALMTPDLFRRWSTPGRIRRLLTSVPLKACWRSGGSAMCHLARLKRWKSKDSHTLYNIICRRTIMMEDMEVFSWFRLSFWHDFGVETDVEPSIVSSDQTAIRTSASSHGRLLWTWCRRAWRTTLRRKGLVHGGNSLDNSGGATNCVDVLDVYIYIYRFTMIYTWKDY